MPKIQFWFFSQSSPHHASVSTHKSCTHTKKNLGMHRKQRSWSHVWKFVNKFFQLPYLLHPQYSQDFARTIIPTGVTLCTITFATYLQIQLFHSPFAADSKFHSTLHLVLISLVILFLKTLLNFWFWLFLL